MKFERLTLENFRQYYGRKRLNFAKDNQKNVTIIHGVNGAGKTSLFVAINWCLYDEGGDNIGELVSKEAIKLANPSDKITMSVELSFSHEGERYVVKRSRTVTKMLDGEAQVTMPDSFTVIRILWDGQAQPVKNAIGTINAILPSNARTYFLFDGEKIDDFAKPEAAKEVKKAIYLIFRLEVLERARKHLEAAASDYRKELKPQTSGELRNLLDDDEKARGELSKSEHRKTEILEEIEAANRRVNDIEQRLREMQNVMLLQQNRDRIEQDLRKWREELANAQNRIRDISTNAYLLLLPDITKKAIDILEEKREKGEIPSNIRSQLVHDLIDQMKCICGRSFSIGSVEHQNLVKLLNNTIPKSVEDDILEVSATLKTFKERSEKRSEDLKTQMRLRATFVDHIKNLEAEADDIGRQLKDSPSEEARQLEQQRQSIRADIDGYNVEIGSLTTNIKTLTETVDQLEKRISAAKKNELREKVLSIKLDLAQRSADAIKEVYNAYADDMRQKIEAKTKEIFKTLVWKESHFHDVRLSSDFELEVIDRYNRPARPEMSAGERQVLSLSFITAMSRISEEEAPLVMDTPFGRLSSLPRHNITKSLPELADQLVLLVTDEELREEALTNLEPRIGNRYRLEFDSSTSCTEIIEVKDDRSN